MKHTRPHNHSDYIRQTPRPAVRSVDGFTRPRTNPQYRKRSSGILPATDSEYMASLGVRASRRDEPAYTDTSSLYELRIKLAKLFEVSRTRKLQISFLSAGFVVFGLFITGAYLLRYQGPAVANQDIRQLLVENGDTPHDKMPYNQSGYAVSSDMSRAIKINKLGINARVVRLGVRENSEPKFPDSIYDVGWYENSAKPGKDGAALLIGHIRGSEKEGVFHDLTNLVPGDEFQLEMGDGSIKNFYIVKMEAYDRGSVDFNALMQSAVPERPGVNLLTAVGALESNAHVTQQLGVFAVEKTNLTQGQESSIGL